MKSIMNFRFLNNSWMICSIFITVITCQKAYSQSGEIEVPNIYGYGGTIKINDTIELAQNIIDQDKKVIIFTNFTYTLQKIHSHFGKQSVYLDGSCTKPQRQYAVDPFQDNDKIKVFVGNLKAAGVGITLTAAEAVIMNDLSFVPSDHDQAQDRAYRYGQKNSVSVYYPIFENTIEGVIYDMLSKKKNIIDTVMGDNIDDKGDFIELLMNKINNVS
jgi:SNF2 family DNA or RNA helicase